ncbi:purine-nucleoside phosphorylase [Pseudomarimonas arenosa]|uniref:Purine nucleoside phosphorylase DeoD-type n=1 Tax=Pseudomarimonas arenosa TaxID=2774145 RepID=A0AAW3ZJD3_9GAMM|nr:purine-nucleoside phosphorylase [Pseudomarimonas arenosa]MBD8526203.1 purine-nucleoside phosphorylase [Pseudomarimonas arenosa]
MSTPHIEADPGAFADTVLLPGDPLRAAYIAERFFSEAECVNTVRNMLGFTGRFRGQRISVMGTGMGIPSCLIYATELVQHYGVRRLLRIGTCGGVAEGLALGDLVLALGACTDSAVNRQRFAGLDFAATASWPLLARIAAEAAAQHCRLKVGNVFSSDLFYATDPDATVRMRRMGVLAVEMEAAGLYGLAAERGVEAAALLSVSDLLPDGASMSAEQRRAGLDRMVELALSAIIEP